MITVYEVFISGSFSQDKLDCSVQAMKNLCFSLHTAILLSRKDAQYTEKVNKLGHILGVHFFLND